MRILKPETVKRDQIYGQMAHIVFISFRIQK